MTPYSDFLPYVIPYVAGCSQPLAEQVIRDVCIDFCTKSLILQTTLDPVSAIAGVTEYDLDAPSGTQVHMVMQAWYLGTPISTFHNDSRINHAELWNPFYTGANTTGGTPCALIQNGHTSFTLNIAPMTSEVNAITLRAAVSPTRVSTYVDDLLFDDYAFEIGQGAIARLVLIPNETFTSPSLAGTYNTIYTSARSLARIRANKAHGRASLRIQPQRF